ncbi:hypothetical protein EDB84DRAFT_1580857 [Lactarius hengduanensis]|nr:hypothetical protein EDB84DRAFT_1580857 [Lactarius hengduanensis]
MRRKLENRPADTRGLLDRLDDASAIWRALPSYPPPSILREPDLPTVQCLASPSHVASRPLTTEDEEASAAAAAVDVDLFLGSTDESHGPFLPPDRTTSTTGTNNTGGDTALQERLAAPLVQMAGQLRRNTERVSGALAAGQGVLSVAEEKVGANLDVMKRERDQRGKALGTTCLTISSVVVVAIAFLVMFNVIRFK